MFTVRLDVDEVDALERRAAGMQLKPSVLARNLIRCGLRPPHSRRVLGAVEAVDQAVETLRELVCAEERPSVR